MLLKTIINNKNKFCKQNINFICNAIILTGCILCAMCIFIFKPMVDMAMNADMLLPFSFVWDVTHHGYAWQGHQLPRLPSLIPDMAVLGTFLLLTGSPRWAISLYGITQLSGFIYVGGWLAAKLSKRSLSTGASALFVVFSLLIAIEFLTGKTDVILSTFLPVDHFGPFLFVIGGGWLASNQISRPTFQKAWGIVAISSLVFVSDRLLIVEFIAPFICASLGILCISATSRSYKIGILRTLSLIITGAFIGLLGFRLMRYSGLHFQKPPEMTLSIMSQASLKFIKHLPKFASTHLWELCIGFVIPLSSFLLFPIILLHREKKFRLTSYSNLEKLPELFLWLMAAASMAGSIVFTACFYADEGNYRYLIALWAWPMIYFASFLLLMPFPSYLPKLTSVLVTSIFLLYYIEIDRGSVGVLQWDKDTASCLRNLRGPSDLHAGLAGYWDARPIELAMNWSIQVDQISEDGHAYIWGNDIQWYKHSFTSLNNSPMYDFIIMRQLWPDVIRARFGTPDEVKSCADTEIWIYRDTSKLYSELLSISPDVAQLSN